MDARNSAPSQSPPIDAAYATMPTRRTIFLRTFLPWQAIRFVVINTKMFRLIWRSHRQAGGVHGAAPPRRTS